MLGVKTLAFLCLSLSVAFSHAGETSDIAQRDDDGQQHTVRTLKKQLSDQQQKRELVTEQQAQTPLRASAKDTAEDEERALGRGRAARGGVVGRFSKHFTVGGLKNVYPNGYYAGGNGNNSKYYGKQSRAPGFFYKKGYNKNRHKKYHGKARRAMKHRGKKRNKKNNKNKKTNNFNRKGGGGGSGGGNKKSFFFGKANAKNGKKMGNRLLDTVDDAENEFQEELVTFEDEAMGGELDDVEEEEDFDDRDLEVEDGEEEELEDEVEDDIEDEEDERDEQ